MNRYRIGFTLPLLIFIALFLPPITGKGIVMGSETAEVVFRVLFSSTGRYVELAAGAPQENEAEKYG